MAWDRKIPFNEKGALMPYVSPWEEQQGLVTWKDSYEFGATMLFVGFKRGRSAAHALFTSEDQIYPMFLVDLEDIMHRGKVGCRVEKGATIGSTVAGRWTFTKRGQNYGIKLVKRGG